MANTPTSRSWTKAQEVAWLDRAIQELGSNSYLGPWLRASRDEIVRDIQSDFLPQCLLPGAAYGKAQGILAEAKVEAAKITQNARDHADGLLTGTRTRLADMKAEAQRALRSVADRL